MLGVMRTEPTWSWAACGKHPAARDFFRIGQDLPLVQNFSEWAAKGYQVLTSHSIAGKNPRSWRFWARGGPKGTLVCGLIRDSSDSLGRCYPLLIMGSGPLQDWEDSWDLLPFACEKTWNEIEYISARIFEDFDIFKKSVENIELPQPRWKDFREKRKAAPGGKAISYPPDLPNDDGNLERQVRLLSDNAEGMVSLDQKPFRDQLEVVGCIHALLKRHTTIAPSAVFVGGTVDKSFLALFRRPLLTADFVRLWSIPMGDTREKGTF
jgi:type VI secretion system protein VasJ